MNMLQINKTCVHQNHLKVEKYKKTKISHETYVINTMVVFNLLVNLKTARKKQVNKSQFQKVNSQRGPGINVLIRF